jgi:NADH-quinone oxidoreductase subunit J
LETAVFIVAAVAAVGAALAMVLAKNAVHAALFLVVVQVALAVFFLLQGAFFVAALQIILYAGAIMVLFVFVIMLLGVDREEALVEPLAAQRPLAIGLALLLIVEAVYLVASRGLEVARAAEVATAEGEGNVEAVARVLFTRWSLPFEVTSVLLVVAIAGVMVLARRRVGP